MSHFKVKTTVVIESEVEAEDHIAVKKLVEHQLIREGYKNVKIDHIGTELLPDPEPKDESIDDWYGMSDRIRDFYLQGKWVSPVNPPVIRRGIIVHGGNTSTPVPPPPKNYP